MKDFTNVVLFSNTSEDAGDLVKAVKEYAKQDINERTKTAYFEYDKTGTKDVKEKVIQDLYFAEIQRRVGFGAEKFDGDIRSYANSTIVREFAQSLDRILLDAVMPLVYDNSALSLIAEFHMAGYGQSFKFDIEDPTLYSVSKLDRRMKHGMTQRKDKSTVVINTDSYAVSSITNLPEIMLGEVMVARELMRMAMSMQRKIYALTIGKFVEKMEAITAPALTLTNYDEKEVIKRLQTVSVYNNNKGILVGAPDALKVVLPASQNTRILLQDEFNTTLGYMSTFNNYDVLALPPVAADDGAYGLTGLPSNRLYIISPTARKLIHVALGATMTNTDGIYENANNSVISTLRQEIGVDIATNAYGAIVKLA